MISSRDVASPPVIKRMTSGSASRSARLSASDMVNWRSNRRPVSRRTPCAGRSIKRDATHMRSGRFSQLGAVPSNGRMRSFPACAERANHLVDGESELCVCGTHFAEDIYDLTRERLGVNDRQELESGTTRV